jgi:PAS domain S-box-containing protein
MKPKVKCWEFFKCKETECPVYESKELRCWLVSGTHCRDEIQGTFLEKVEICLGCEPFRANVDPASLEQTVKVVHEQFLEFRRMVEERDRELEGISMEMALGLSEVFEALRQISSGNPEVRIAEASELELIAKLKNMVNLTAINLAGIVNLSHEFAIGLAEHFDVLHRVSKGDLNARVSGISQVELLEYLKKVTNETIESVSREIADRKRAEGALRESERDYRTIIEKMVDIYYRADLEGNLMSVSPSAVKLLGYDSTDELMGRSLAKDFYYRPDDREAFLKDLKKHGELTSYEIILRNKDGTPVVGETSSHFVYDDSGEPIAVEGIFRDITERKRTEETLRQYREHLEELVKDRTGELTKANELLQQEISYRMRKEEALRLSEERYRALFMNNPIETIIVDREGKVTGFNKAKEEGAKEKPNDRLPELGDRMYKDYAGKHRINMHKELMECLRTGKPKDFPELQYDYRFLHINISPFSHGAIITSIDITERKLADKALRASEEKYSGLVENSLTGIYIDHDRKIVFANKRFAEIYGYSDEELLAMESWKLVHPDDRALTDSIRTKRLEGEYAPSEYEARGLTKGGETLWITRRNTRIEYQGAPAILGNIADITERKRAEEALHDRTEQLNAQARSLEEVNTALKVLLKQREEDKGDLEEKVLSNVKELVLPYVAMLNNTRLNTRQAGYVSIIESSLDDIVSPFLGKLSSKYLGLTPREIQIADLIKHGKTSKEIAELLSVSTRAVEFHRENLRGKLGLKNRSANLRSHLLGFQKY